MAACFDCETLVATLGSRPPTPLILEAPGGEYGDGDEQPRQSRMRLLGPLLAAAAAVLELLHARYPTDARAFARTLPPSEERNEYLSRVSGR